MKGKSTTTRTDGKEEIIIVRQGYFTPPQDKQGTGFEHLRTGTKTVTYKGEIREGTTKEGQQFTAIGGDNPFSREGHIVSIPTTLADTQAEGTQASSSTSPATTAPVITTPEVPTTKFFDI